MSKTAALQVVSGVALLGAIGTLWAAPVAARDTELFFNVKRALESDTGKAKLLEVPVYFRGARTPSFGRERMEVTAERTTRGAFRSDLSSCQVAFLSAVIVLQQRAQQESAAAVVDIVSITRGKLTESASQFRCVAGTTIVHVGLRGKLVAAAADAKDAK